MSDWTGGFGGSGRPPQAKIPVKVHRNVSLILAGDSFVADEMLSRNKLSQHLVGRMTPDVLLIRPGKAAEVVAELKKMGHTPKVEGIR